MAEKFVTPDVRELAGRDLHPTPFPSDRAEAFRVYFSPGVHEQIRRHARADTSVEICGVLVGKWEQDQDGPFVAVRESIRCEAAVSKSGEVTFTHDAWAEINQQMDTRFADSRIVGWYHSHPSFGVFLSGRDRFIQEHFFCDPGQIAYVVDPANRTEGVFVWREGKPTLAAHYWVGDRLFPEAVGNEAMSEETPARADPAAAAQPGAGPADSGGSLLRGVVLGVAMLVVGYLLAAIPSAWERNRLVEGTVAHYGVWKGLRPGLKEYLDTAEARLGDVAATVHPLARDHLTLVGSAGSEEDAASKEAQWNQVQDDLEYTRRLLEAIEATYCLTPEESAAVAKVVAAKLAELGQGRPDAETREPAGTSAKNKSTKQAEPGSEQERKSNQEPKGGGPEPAKPDARDPSTQDASE